jgi:glycosyltransferase involved in cell wall biosynthesis
MNDDITVVITCFNDGVLLAEAVRSTLTQAGGPPQLVVVDDGSTDPQTLRLLGELPQGVTLVRQENRGTSAARNAGLGTASTPYLLVLDADDRLAPDALMTLRAGLDANPDAGFCYGLATFFGSWEGVLRLPPYDPYKLLHRSLVPATALMRRTVFDSVGGFDAGFDGYEDWEFWVHALARGWRGVQVEAVTLLYRRRATSRHVGARARYRHWYRQLRRKHAPLFTGTSRRRLGAESDLGLLGRGLYRWWWGIRPLPAHLELALQGFLWRRRSGAASSGAARR